MKLLDDTIKKCNGKYDKQAITMLVSFAISIALGISNTIMSYVLNITNNNTADNVFNSFMILTGAMSGVNVYNKIVDIKAKKEEDKEEEIHE